MSEMNDFVMTNGNMMEWFYRVFFSRCQLTSVQIGMKMYHREEKKNLV